MKQLNLLLILILLLQTDSIAQFQKGSHLLGIHGDIGQSVNLNNSKQSGFYFNPKLKYGYFFHNRVSAGMNLSIDYFRASRFKVSAGPYISVYFPIKEDAFFIETAYSFGNSSYTYNNNSKFFWSQRENKLEFGPGYMLMLSKYSLLQMSVPISFSWYNFNESALIFTLDRNWESGFNVGLKVGLYFLLLPHKNEK